jgi:hypothetical protein
VPEDYVMPDARFAEAVHEMSGAPPQQGMAPYPLYGIPPLGSTESAVPLWHKPIFCYAVGAIAGFGLGYAFFGWFKPKYMRKNPTKKPAKNPRSTATNSTEDA